MGACILPLIKRNVIIYKPEQWSTRLGEPCKSCNRSLNHQKCISVCKCYYFCHQECFSTQFQQQLLSQFTEVKCYECDYKLRMVMETQYKYQPEFTKSKIIKLVFWLILIILTLLSIMFTANSGIKIDFAYFVMYVEGILLGILIFFFVQSIKQIIYHKSIKIKDIFSTQLEIETSAFRDFDCETRSQTSKQCIAVQKNK